MSNSKNAARMRVARALDEAHRCGLFLRVFDGTVFLLDAKQLDVYRRGPRYDDWIDVAQEAEVLTKIGADGGAGW